ncbi:MAG: LPS assembly protein LptD, partial [Pseudomonadota bacterium]
MTQAQGRGFDDWTVDPDSPCLGRYTPPTLPTLNTPGLHIEANESELNPNSYSTLQGDVLIRYGLHQLEADQATVITAPKNLRHVESLTATGAVRYRGPLAQMLAKQAFLDLSNHELTLEDAEYRIYTRPIRGTAKHIKVDAQDRIFLTQAEYTACPPGHCDWLFTADEVMIDIDNDYSTIKGGWLRINRVPVFYFPYLNVALDRSRKSGLLFPYFANSSQSGMITGIPYYFNLAPNYDLMLTPRWYQQRGLSMTSHVRYLTEKSSGHFEWFILPQDRKYHTFRTDKWAYHPSITTDTDPRLTELKGSNRQFVHWIHQSDISSHLRLNANIDWVADQNYFVDFFESLEKQSTDKVTQGLQVTYQDSNTNAVLLFQNNQALHSFNGPPRTEIYRLLPQLSASSTLPTPHQWLALTWQADAAHFTSKRDQLTG